jgi:hypothetical protein
MYGRNRIRNDGERRRPVKSAGRGPVLILILAVAGVLLYGVARVDAQSPTVTSDSDIVFRQEAWRPGGEELQELFLLGDFNDWKLNDPAYRFSRYEDDQGRGRFELRVPRDRLGETFEYTYSGVTESRVFYHDPMYSHFRDMEPKPDGFRTSATFRRGHEAVAVIGDLAVPPYDSSGRSSVEVDFTIAGLDDAFSPVSVEAVYLAGDFNDWDFSDAEYRLVRDGGRYSLTAAFAPDTTISYRYIVYLSTGIRIAPADWTYSDDPRITLSPEPDGYLRHREFNERFSRGVPDRYVSFLRIR